MWKQSRTKGAWTQPLGRSTPPEVYALHGGPSVYMLTQLVSGAYEDKNASLFSVYYVFSPSSPLYTPN